MKVTKKVGDHKVRIQYQGRINRTNENKRARQEWNIKERVK